MLRTCIDQQRMKSPPGTCVAIWLAVFLFVSCGVHAYAQHAVESKSLLLTTREPANLTNIRSSRDSIATIRTPNMGMIPVGGLGWGVTRILHSELDYLIQQVTLKLLDWHDAIPKDQGPEHGQQATENSQGTLPQEGQVQISEPFTFFATSDSHYEAVEKVERNDRNRITIQRMNELPGESWPEKLGGGAIGKPRGVLALGDLIDDGDKAGQTDIEWLRFEEHFGLDGTDGLLRFPVFEGWGNHDGPPENYTKQRTSIQRQIRIRNQIRLEKGLIANISPNGLHYAWDWNGIHFIQTNLYPADRQNQRVRYSLPWHDPQNALTFVKEDLANSVGTSGRPVIIMAHCGFDTDWWVLEDWVAFYDTVRSYNLIAYFHGHSGTGVRSWKPEGEEKAIDIINTGQTEKGFFVVEVGMNRMRLGFHAKKDPTDVQSAQWEWRHFLDKKY